MIFYFTGTGNSRWVAETLGRALREPLIPVVDALRSSKAVYAYPLGEKEKAIFVFPVHSWGPAVLMRRFISRLTLEGYVGQAVYFVCTCGDDCGYTDRVMRKALAGRGLTMTEGFSVRMPNNYVLMAGFDVDSEDVAQEKLREAPDRLQTIIASIWGERHGLMYHAGRMPFLKTYLVHPLFVRWVTGKTRFYATDACVSCGLCAKICPTGTITMDQAGKPRWADSCVQCVACIHRCPLRAIEYGKVSLRKGRYHHPEITNQ